MISNSSKAFARGDIAPQSSADVGARKFVLVETRDGTSKLTLDQVKSFESDFFDGWLECALKPEPDGNLKLVLPVNTKVWKRAVTCMEAKNYSAPPAWAGDDVLLALLDEQLSYFAPRPLTSAIGRAEAAKNAPAGFVRIEPGEFMMGSPDDEAGRFPDEAQHRVELTRAFWYQATPVTQGQWQGLMGNNPSHYRTDGPNGELASERPVVNVNWYEAAAYCNALSAKEGLAPYYEFTGAQGTAGADDYVRPSRVSTLSAGVDSYRLPSEAEQERARRGSDASTSNNATYAPQGKGLNDIAWYWLNSGTRTHPVARLLPTNEGVFDALGNVSEWGNDWYDDHPLEQNATGKTVDPVRPGVGGAQVYSGGCWGSSERCMRAAYRGREVPHLRSEGIGFRPARFAA